MRSTLIVALALLVLACATSSVSASVRVVGCGHLSARAQLACGHKALRQARSGERWTSHHRVRAASAHDHSLGFWRWRERVAERWIAQAHAALRPVIAHLALWMCIHRREAGSWYDEDSGHNGHYGGLQMSYGWDGLVGDAARLSPYEQMFVAETGYRQHGYSRSWLLGQWDHPQCLAYA
jgi:hypothetical protein